MQVLKHSSTSPTTTRTGPRALTQQQCAGAARVKQAPELQGVRRCLRNSGRRVLIATRSTPKEEEANTPDERDDLEKIVFLGNGDAVSLTQRSRKYIRPALDLSKEAVVATQLQALAHNHKPYRDHGVEVLYRFASFDPFTRSNYFGRSIDLGQFERFRRVMHTKPFNLLIEHESHTVLSALEVSERLWKQRVLVRGPRQGGREPDECVFEFTLSQRLGGCYDGYWFTESIIADHEEEPSGQPYGRIV